MGCGYCRFVISRDLVCGVCVCRCFDGRCDLLGVVVGISVCS